MSKKMKQYVIGLFIAIFIYTVAAWWMTIRGIILPPELIDTIILFILAAATIFYAIRTSDIAEATRGQAEEMKAQRVWASRPFIVQRAEQKKAVEKTITTDYFSHFEIYNAGNGPAIEVETSLLNEKKSLIYSDRVSYLRPGEAVRLLPVEFGKAQPLPDIEPPVKPFPINLAIRKKCTYLVSEYQNIFSSKERPTWYQTWLPFAVGVASKKNAIYVKPGELEFKEVSEKERINAFGGGSKPK